jgi:hypothetical protein
MKSIRSRRHTGILMAAILLPLSIPAIHPHHPESVIPALAGSESLAIDAAETASLLVDAIIVIESNGDPQKVGRHGERGLMQIRAGTWRDMTARMFGQPLPFDRAFEPGLNRRVGTAYLAYLQEKLLPRRPEWKADERSLLLAAYNGGPGRLRKAGFDPRRLSHQTRDYVERTSAIHDVLLADLAGPVRQRLLAAAAVPSSGI